jgi:hypothetical protein
MAIVPLVRNITGKTEASQTAAKTEKIMIRKVKRNSIK